MTDWKEERIKEYHALEKGKQMTIEEMGKNPALSNLRLQIEDMKRQLFEQESEYKVEIRACDEELQTIREDLIKRWDIEDKTYKCDAGTATIRTTKSLVITDKATLIKRLASIFDGDTKKACSFIRSFDLSGIRTYMDADLIARHIAHYDENQSVVIKGVDDK